MLVGASTWIGGTYLFAYLTLRFAMAWTVGVWGIGDEVLRRKIWLVALRDAIHFVVWLGSFRSKYLRRGKFENYLSRNSPPRPQNETQPPRPPTQTFAPRTPKY